MCRGSFLLLILVFLTTNVYALSGSGTQADPWLIQSLADFNVFAAEENYWDDYTRLETDIDLAGITYTTAVIAFDTDYSSSYTFEGVPFTGEFNGNGYRILNLTIDTGGIDKDYLGFFGMIDAGGVVVNLGLEDVSVTGSGNWTYGDFTGNFGALVGVNRGTIQDCWVNVSITGGNYSEDIGGLCGWNEITGSISRCYVIGSVGSGANSGGIGGLCGSNDGSIINCWASSSVTGRNSLGGLCGFLDGGSITNSYSTGLVNGTAEYLGGLIGERNGGIITNCFWDTQTSGMLTSNGGIGKTTAEMKQKSTFTNWDFDVIWKIVENTTYPYLAGMQNLSVDIDIKPGSDPNSINLCSNGAVPIALMGSDTFNVAEVNTETLRFSEASVKVVGKKDPHTLCSYEYVNGDSFVDLVCHFVTADLAGINGESTSATVNGELLDGTPIEGTDRVNIVKDTCN